MVCVIILEDLADLFDNKRSAQQTLWSKNALTEV